MAAQPANDPEPALTPQIDVAINRRFLPRAASAGAMAELALFTESLVATVPSL